MVTLCKLFLYNYNKMNWLKTFSYVPRTNCSFVSELGRLCIITSKGNFNKSIVRCCSTEAASPADTNQKPPGADKVYKQLKFDRGEVIRGGFNFAMYADQSPLIQKFIDLGVNLYKLQKNPKAANYLLTLNFKKIKRLLFFLTDNGVPAEKIGNFITENPYIFKEHLDDLDVRINYLKSKNFDKEMIAAIITRNPQWLSTPVKQIDERLGFLQLTFNFQGKQVREIISKLPKLGTANKEYILLNNHTLKEELGIDKYDLKRVILAQPKLLLRSSFDLIVTYEYLTKTMKVSPKLIVKQPNVLTYRKCIIEPRHRFLESLGRAQYCNFLPGYVNLLSLVETTDSEFCENVAKTSENIYYDFLKTL